MSAIRQFSSYATVFLLFFSFFFASKNSVAQVPEGVNYQAVARNSNGDPLANQIVSVRFSIVATSTSGTVLYEEEHSTISTNDFGLFNLIIGRGTRTGGTAANFAAIDWGSGNRYLRVQVDAGNGFENLGTTQLLSVPYALYAKTTGNSSSTLIGGDGIILRNDSIINDGDLSDNNELITSFSIETGNILRITEAATNYDVDLTPLLGSNTDNQNLRFSSGGDSILIDGGDGIEIQPILDDIAANAADISVNTTAISNLDTRFQADSTNNADSLAAIRLDLDNLNIVDYDSRISADSIRLVNLINKLVTDSTAIANAINLNATDISNLDARILADSIRNADSLADIRADLEALNIIDFDPRITADSIRLVNLINKLVADSTVITNNIAANATGIIDSTNDIRAALLDTAAVLRTLFGTGSDNQNLTLVNDSITIDGGAGVDLAYIKDSLTDHNTKIYTNSAGVSTAQNAIATNITDISALQTDVTNNAIGIIDSTNDIRAALLDTAADLRTLFGTGSDNQNLTLVNDSITIDGGTGVDLAYIKDSLTDHNTKIYTNSAGISTAQNAIATNITDISALQTDVTNNATGIIDSTNDIRAALLDTAADLRTLFGTGSDNQNLTLVNDSITIDGGTGVDLAYIKDSLADHNTKIYTNSAGISTAQNAIVANITAISDSALNVRSDLADTALTLRNLITTEDSTRIANGTSRIFIPTTNDSISFVAGGNEALRINNSGTSYFKQQVGVNTNSPGALLGVLSNNQGVAQFNRAIGRDTPPIGLSLDVDGGSSGLTATGITSTTYGTGKSIGIRSFARTTHASDSIIAFFASAVGNENSFAGFFKNGNVYIGDTLILPTNSGRGKVLTSDANGKAIWQTQSGIGSGNVGELTFFTADDSLRSSPALFWDEANERLGLGMSTPAAKLCIWDTLFNNNTTVNVRTYADNTFPGGNIYAINSYIENEPFTSIDTAFGLNTKVTGDAEYKFGVNAYVYGGPTPQKYYALYGVADGSQEAYGLYTKAINGWNENWSAYLDTGNVYIEDTLILNRPFKLATGATNGSVLTSDANGVANWSPAGTYGNVNTIASNTAGRVAYWNSSDSITFYDDLFIDETNNRVGIGTTSPSQKLQVNGGIRVSAGFNANNGTQGSPAFRFETDPNTGMYSDAADELAFTTGGAEAARFDASGNLGIGTTTPDSTLTINGSIKTTYFTMTDGAASGSVLTSDANGVATWEVLPGTDTLNIIADADRNTFISIDASDIIHFNQNGTEYFRMDSSRLEFLNTDNLFIGGNAGANTTNVANTAIGNNALQLNTTGSDNVVLGRGAMRNNNSGASNVAIGNYALEDVLAGVENVAIGYRAGGNVTGSSNTFLGHATGYSATPKSIDGSVFIGRSAGNLETNDDRLYIENSNSTTPLIYGNFASDSVKIFGTFGIGNEYSFPDTAGTPAQILIADPAGNPIWSSTLPATTCPTGMSNIAGTNICIDTDERSASSNWFDAAATCVSAGYKLPNWAEWYGAAAALALTNETDDWEWVSDGTSNTARKVGNGDIKATANDDPDTGGASFRCIFYK